MDRIADSGSADGGSNPSGYTKKTMEPKDSNGNILQAGDSVVVTQTLKVKGFSSGIKRGTVVKNIRLTDDEDAIEGKVEGSVIVIKTCYLKKK